MTSKWYIFYTKVWTALSKSPYKGAEIAGAFADSFHSIGKSSSML